VFVGLLIALTSMVYWRCLGSDFVAWDDDINVFRNPHIQELNSQTLLWMFTDTATALRYKPLSWLVWALICACAGLEPFLFHVVNLLLHIANTALAFLVVEKLVFRTKPGESSSASPFQLMCSAVGALFWSLHPLRAEPVAWVTGLPYCLALFFLLGSFLAFLHYRELPSSRPKRFFYAASISLFVLSSLAYPIGLAFPAVLMVLDLLLPVTPADGERTTVRAGWKLLRDKLPYACVSAVVVGIAAYGRVHADGIWARPVPFAEFGFFARVMQAFYVWAIFVWKSLIPAFQSPVYPTLVSFNPFDWAFLLSAGLVLGVSGLAVVTRQTHKPFLALWLAYLLLLVPMLGLTEHPHFASDRYSIVAAIVWSIGLVALLKTMSRLRSRYLWVSGAMLMVVCFAGLAHTQTAVWKDSVSLFEHASKNNPPGSPCHKLVRLRLAAAYSVQHRYSDAAHCYEELAAAEPDDRQMRQRLQSTLSLLHHEDESRATASRNR